MLMFWYNIVMNANQHEMPVELPQLTPQEMLLEERRHAVLTHETIRAQRIAGFLGVLRTEMREPGERTGPLNDAERDAHDLIAGAMNGVMRTNVSPYVRRYRRQLATEYIVSQIQVLRDTAEHEKQLATLDRVQ